MAMRIFLAGASGVIGQRLIPRLVQAGHVVGGMTRSPTKTELLRHLGAEPILCDVFDREALIRPRNTREDSSPSWLTSVLDRSAFICKVHSLSERSFVLGKAEDNSSLPHRRTADGLSGNRLRRSKIG